MNGERHAFDASKDSINFQASFYVIMKHMDAMRSPNVKTKGY